MLDVMLLGTGAMVPLPDRYLSAAQFRIGSSLYLIDCGEGTQVSMRRFHWGFRKLRGILLTHFHADHIAGLPGLLHTIMHSGKTDPLDIFGPPGTYDLMQAFQFIAPIGGFDVFVHELEGGDEAELTDGAILRTAWGEHRGACLTYRVDIPRAPAFLPATARDLAVPQKLWGALQRGESVYAGEQLITPQDVTSGARPGIALGFATDTRPTDGIADLMHGVDLLITEGTFGDDADEGKANERGHMTFRQAATMAAAADVGGHWLTHFGAGMRDPHTFLANATQVFPRSEIGQDGLTGRLAFDRGYERVGVATGDAGSADEPDKAV